MTIADLDSLTGGDATCSLSSLLVDCTGEGGAIVVVVVVVVIGTIGKPKTVSETPNEYLHNA